MDWKNTIAEIQEKGNLTQPQIAAIVGCGQATISDLSAGKTKEPRHSLGQSLLALLARVRGEDEGSDKAIPTATPAQLEMATAAGNAAGQAVADRIDRSVDPSVIRMADSYGDGDPMPALAESADDTSHGVVQQPTNNRARAR